MFTNATVMMSSKDGDAVTLAAFLDGLLSIVDALDELAVAELEGVLTRLASPLLIEVDQEELLVKFHGYKLEAGDNGSTNVLTAEEVTVLDLLGRPLVDGDSVSWRASLSVDEF